MLTTSRKATVLLLLSAVLLSPSFAAGASPQVSFQSANPALLVLFDQDRSPYSISGGTSSYFGAIQFQQGTWQFDGRAAYTSSPGATLRYRTTLENGTPQARNSAQDWVAQIRYRHTGAYNYDAPWYLKNWDADTKMITLVNTGGGDSWQLLAGNAQDGWSVVLSNLSLGTGYNTFIFLFKSNGLGGGSIDAYMNDVLIAANITLGHGNYALDHVQLQSLGAGTDWFEVVKIGDRASRFGHDWVRNHDFTVNALAVCPGSLDDSGASDNLYRQAGLTSTLVWEAWPALMANAANRVGLPWFYRVANSAALPNASSQFGMYDASGHPGLGIHLPDEPITLEMGDSLRVQRAFKAGYPTKVTWGNLGVFPKPGKEPELYRGSLASVPVPPGYDYKHHVEDYLDIVRPDVLSFDNYPFNNSNAITDAELRTRLFQNMEIIRSRALEYDVPYFAYVQAFYYSSPVLPDESTALPSESDLRMNVNALLAYGAKGISYFLWAQPPQTDTDTSRSIGIVEVDSACSIQSANPTPLHARVQSVTRDAKNLGKALKHLRSVAVRYIRGKDSNGETRPLPDGTIAANSPESCTGGYVTSIGAKVTAGNGTEEGDLLLGCFTPEKAYDGTGHEGDLYFMIVNLHRGKEMTSAEARQDVTLRFDFGSTGITSLQRLNHVTGTVVEEVQLVNDGGSQYHITFDVDGGEGYLFRYRIPGKTFIGVD